MSSEWVEKSVEDVKEIFSTVLTESFLQMDKKNI